MTDTSKNRRVSINQMPRMIRRTELRRIVPLADSTIYELEQSGNFPRRFSLTPRCVVWDLSEVETWIEERRQASKEGRIVTAPSPDIRKRRSRPVKRPRLTEV